MNDFQRQSIGGSFRHVVTTIGGALAAKGVIEASDVELYTGAIMALAGFAWSIYQKRKANK